jgi:multidrug efflux system membrane fusion protein
VPSEAVQTGQQGQHVFVVRGDSAVDVRPVIVGRSINGETIVDQGLKVGERVVTDGQFLLGPGSRIQVKTAKDSSEENVKGSGKEDARRRKETVS